MTYSDFVADNKVLAALVGVIGSSASYTGVAFDSAVQAAGFSKSLQAFTYAKNNSDRSSIGVAVALGFSSAAAAVLESECGSQSLSQYIKGLDFPSGGNIQGAIFPGGAYKSYADNQTLDNDMALSHCLIGLCGINDSFGANTHILVQTNADTLPLAKLNGLMNTSQTAHKTSATYVGKLVDSNVVGNKVGAEGVRVAESAGLTDRNSIRKFAAAGLKFDLNEISTNTLGAKDKFGSGFDLGANATNFSGTAGTDHRARNNHAMIQLQPSIASGLGPADIGFYGNGIALSTVVNDGTLVGVKEASCNSVNVTSLKRHAPFNIGRSSLLPASGSFTTGGTVAAGVAEVGHVIAGFQDSDFALAQPVSNHATRGVGLKFKFVTNEDRDVTQILVANTVAGVSQGGNTDGTTVTFTATPDSTGTNTSHPWLEANKNLVLTLGGASAIYSPAAEWWIDSCHANAKGGVDKIGLGSSSGAMVSDSDIMGILSAQRASDLSTLGYSVSDILGQYGNSSISDLYGAFARDGLDNFIKFGLEYQYNSSSGEYTDSGKVVNANTLINQLADSGVGVQDIKNSSNFKSSLAKNQTSAAGSTYWTALSNNAVLGPQLTPTDIFTRLDSTKNDLRSYYTTDNWDATSQEESQNLVKQLDGRDTQGVIDWFYELLSDSQMNGANNGLVPLDQDQGQFFGSTPSLKEKIAASLAFGGVNTAQRENYVWGVAQAYCMGVDLPGYMRNVAKMVKFDGAKKVGEWNSYTSNDFYCAGPSSMKSNMAPTADFYAAVFNRPISYYVNHAQGPGKPLIADAIFNWAHSNHFSGYDNDYSPRNLIRYFYEQVMLEEGLEWNDVAPGLRVNLAQQTSVISAGTATADFYGTAKTVAATNDPANADHNLALNLGSANFNGAIIETLTNLQVEATVPALNVEYVSQRFDNSASTTVFISNHNLAYLLGYVNSVDLLGLGDKFVTANSGLLQPSLKITADKMNVAIVLFAHLVLLSESNGSKKRNPLNYTLADLLSLDNDLVEQFLSAPAPATLAASSTNLSASELSSLVYQSFNISDDEGEKVMKQVLGNLHNQHGQQQFLKEFVTKEHSELFGSSALAFDASSPLKLGNFIRQMSAALANGAGPALYYLAASGEVGSTIQQENLKKAILFLILRMDDSDRDSFFASLPELNKSYTVNNRMSQRTMSMISAETNVFSQGQGVSLTSGLQIMPIDLLQRFPKQ